jgi:hypothetical protein
VTWWEWVNIGQEMMRGRRGDRRGSVEGVCSEAQGYPSQQGEQKRWPRDQLDNLLLDHRCYSFLTWRQEKQVMSIPLPYSIRAQKNKGARQTLLPAGFLNGL